MRGWRRSACSPLRPPATRWAWGAVGPEPADDVGVGQGGELAQGADAEPGEQPGEVTLAEDAYRQRGEEPRGSPGRDDQAPAGGQHGGEQPVGHTDLGRADTAGGRLDEFDQGAFAAEVPSRPPRRQRADAGTHRGHPRAVGLDGGDHLGEGAEHGTSLVLEEEFGAVHDQQAIHVSAPLHRHRRPSHRRRAATGDGG